MSNGIYLFYLISLIPSILGTILFICNRKINWLECLGGTVVAFIVSGMMHGIAIWSMTDDIETLSGQITHVAHFPSWRGRYTEIHVETHTDSKGHTHTTTRTDTHYENHPEHWEAYLSFGILEETKRIDKKSYEEIIKNFGNQTKKTGNQSCWHSCTCVGGDSGIYTTLNVTGYLYPVTTLHHFENRIKAAPTLFSFPKVPNSIKVYDWPKNPNSFESDRLLGSASSFLSIREWDAMNSRLGFSKRANLIMVGFGSDSSLGEWQRAKWIGGKKNDLVLCYGMNSTNVVWSKVFGWSESEICKRNLESLLLSTPVNNQIIPLIEKEVRTNYKRKEWKKFDYIVIEPPLWSYIVLFIVMVITQAVFWIWAHRNEFER